MNAIIVIYTNEKVLTDKLKGSSKHYSFNTESDLKVGDIIKSPSYTTNMMIIKVFDEAFTYLNNVTGELSNNYNSVNQREIRTLVIREDEKEVIYGSLVKN